MKNFILSLILMAVFTTQISLAAPVNINDATAQELAENLQGVGIKKAQAIVQYREKIGGFQSQKQLLNVKGIGKATLEKNQSNILME